MATQITTSKYNFTADAIVAVRDEQQMSWPQVAKALGLGSPGTARRAYTALVRPHTESVLTRTTTRTAAVTPVDLAGMKLAELRDTLVGRTLVVDRGDDRTERIACAKVTSLKDGTINFNDGSKRRSVKATAVVALAK